MVVCPCDCLVTDPGVPASRPLSAGNRHQRDPVRIKMGHNMEDYGVTAHATNMKSPLIQCWQ